MATTTKATTALVAAALGLATVTAAFVTISSTSSVADAPTVKIQDRLKSEVRLISIDDADAGETTVVRSDAARAETVAIRVVPLPQRAPRITAAPAEVHAAVTLPQPKPAGLEAFDVSAVPLPQPRPDDEMIVGALTPQEQTATR